MPTVNRQVANGPAKVKKQGVLERVQPVMDMPKKGLTFCVYGRTKTGKTRFSCTFPKPMLLIGTEDGTDSVKNVQGVDFIRITSSDDLEQLTTHLKNGGGSCWQEEDSELTKVDMGEGSFYKSVWLDHGGGYQDIVLREVLGLEELPIQMTWGTAKQENWLATGAQFKERLSKLLDLADTHGTNIGVIAHEKDFNENSSASDMLSPTIAAALSPTIARWLNGEMNYIGHTFIREQEATKKFKQGVGPQAKVVERKVKTGKKEYCLRVGPHTNYITGFRHVPGFELPDSVADPSYDKMVRLINGEGLEE